MMDTSAHRSWNMSRIRHRDTSPERIVRGALCELGQYRRYRLNCRSLPGKPDVVFGRVKKVIFVNGCFWHQHPRCDRKSMPKTNRRYWTQKLVGNVVRQRGNIRLLAKEGWHVAVMWECETKNLTRLNSKLRDFLYEK